MGLFDGKVVVITGAGGGIGRAHALAFASEGAKVVVNDLGGTRDGSGNNSSMADQVVAEIKAMGREAVANYDNVAVMEGAERLVKTAVDAFGGVDILVNNAGILRDKTLLKMEEPMWDAVIAVHLKGTFCVTQVAARKMVEQGRGGRIINTTSLAGLLGNFGQANYSAAKAGIYGFTMTMSMELRKAGITVNAIAPVAKTRMTDDISAVPEEMKPEQISPMVVFLASEHAADITGGIFGIHGQQIFLYKMHQTPGVTKESEALWTVSEIKEALPRIMSEKPEAAPAPAAAPADPLVAAFGLIPHAFAPEKAAGKKFNIFWDIKGGTAHSVILADGQLKVVQGKDGTPSCTVTADADTVLAIFTGKTKAESAFMAGKIKATNIGDMMTFGQVIDMKKAKDIAEKAAAAPAPAAAPVAAAAPAADPLVAAFGLIPHAFAPEKAAGKKFNIFWDIKGGTAHSVILADGQLKVVQGKDGTPSCTVTADADTVLAIFTGKTKAESAFMAGKIKATNIGDMMTFGQVIDMKKAKDIAEKAAAAPAPAAAPVAAAPAAGGDPLVAAFGLIPQAFAPEKATGKKFNIFWDITGGSAHSVILADGQLKVVQGKEGTPSCTVTTDKDTVLAIFTGKTKAESAFMAGKIKATNIGDMMTFGQVIDMKKAKAVAEQAAAAPAPAAAPAAAAPSAGGDPLVAAFGLIPHAFAPEKAGGKKFNIFWDITGGTAHSVILADGQLRVAVGKEGTPSCTVTTDADTVLAIFTGKTKAESAFMAGKIKATNIGDMMTFGQVIDMKKAKAVAEQATAAPAPAAVAAPTAAAKPAATSGDPLAEAFEMLPEGLKADKVGDWKANIFFDVKGTGGWTLSVSGGKASTSAGKAASVDATLTISSSQLALDILNGVADPQKAFTQGKITSSNLGMLMKFAQLFKFEPREAPKGPNRTPFIGRSYDGSLSMVMDTEMLAYAASVNDDNPAYTDTTKGIMAHPIFPVRVFIDGMYKVATDQDLQLDLVRLVHGEQDMVFHKPIRPGDLMNIRFRLKNVQEKESGTTVTVQGYAFVDGERAVDADSVLFIRSRGKNPSYRASGAPEAKPAPAERGPIVIRDTFTVDKDQASRYADSSLDRNPIHLDEGAARAAGLPGIILHGLCTMAMSTKGIVNQAVHGDAAALKRYAVRFAKPVFPGDTLTTEAWVLKSEGGVTSYGFEVKNQDGVVVISNGIAEVLGAPVSAPSAQA